MSPLQLSVYWRLSLIYFLSPFYFFIDIFTTAITTATCHLGNITLNGTLAPGGKFNQSWHVEGKANRTTESGEDDSVCGWTDLLPYGQTLFMIGMLLGSLVGGAISDRYGKCPTLLVCAFTVAVCGLVPVVLQQPLPFLAIRCLVGVCCSCINICAFSLAVEWTLPAARLWPPAFLPFCFSLGMMCGALLAWLSPTVRWLHLLLALPQLLCLPLFFTIPESPSWLLVRRRMRVLDRYHSNSPADKHHLDLLLESAMCDLQRAAETPPPGGHAPSGGHAPPGGRAPSDLVHLRHPTVLLRLFIMSFLGTVSALTYFGICMNVGSFGVSVYSAQFFSGLSEAPCLLVPLVRLGRRPISMLTLFLSGAACFLLLLLSKHNAEPVLVMSLALLGKLCILAAIFIFVLYGIELFPTVVRQRCLAIINLCFRVGSLVNYLFNSSGEISPAAMVVYSGGPIIGCGLCLLLPETSGIPLPDTVEDCDRQPLSSINGTLCGTRKMVSSQSMKTEISPAEKDDTHTPETHNGLL